MVLRQPFVAPAIIAGDAGHDLLLRAVISAIDISEEIRRRLAAQGRGQLAAVMHEHLAVLGRPIGESQIAAHGATPAEFLGDQQPNLIGYHFLQPPEGVVADAELFQLAHCMKQILRARADMAAGTGQGPRHVRQRQRDIEIRMRSVGPKHQGFVRCAADLDVDPAHGLDAVMAADLPPQQPADLPTVIVVAQPVGNALAASAAFQPHHQAGLPRRAAPARQLHAEGAVPAGSGGAPMLDRVELGLPDQRAIGEQPERSMLLPLQQVGGGGVILLFGELGIAVFRAGIGLFPMTARHQLRRQ